MGNNKIKNLIKPTEDSDAATKLYVDESKVDGSVFLKLDAWVSKNDWTTRYE